MSNDAVSFVRLVKGEPWMADASCRGMQPELFFPSFPDGPDHALEVCQSCPVQAECREYGRDERFGVWGGTTPKERSPRSQRTAPPPCGTWLGYHRHRRNGTEPCRECRVAWSIHRNPEQRSLRDIG